MIDKTRLESIIRRDLNAVKSIYPSIKEAFYYDPEERLIEKIVSSIEKELKIK